MRLIGFLLAAMLAPNLALADDTVVDSELAELLQTKIRTVRHMALNPVLIDAVRRQNDSGIGLEEIKKRDDEWRKTKELTQLKRELGQNKAGKLLTNYVTRNDALNEAFLTDNQGANVAAFPPTSDYWQGDEEKWSESFNGGDGRVFVGPLEYDESTKTTAVQISMPMLHFGETIGVLVVGVTVDYLEHKMENH